MRYIFLFLLINICFSTIIESDYEPMNLVPHGYVMWLQDGKSESIYSFLLTRTAICQMQISKEDWLAYRIVNATDTVEDDKDWTKLIGLDKILTPETCFLYSEGIGFIVRKSNGDFNLILLGDDTRVYNFGSTIDLIRFDVINHYLYLHANKRLYKIRPNVFVEKVSKNDLKLNNYKYENTYNVWSDMIVVENYTYFIMDKIAYLFEKNQSSYVTHLSDSDKFYYLLVPTYEKFAMSLVEKSYTYYCLGFLIFIYGFLLSFWSILLYIKRRNLSNQFVSIV